MPTEQVNHPAHYTAGGIEVIAYLRAKLTPEEFRGFCKGNALKYLSRAGHKGDAATDIAKARWYLAELDGEHDMEERAMAPTRTDRDWEYLPDVRLRELAEQVARLTEALDSCHATITLGSRDWGMSKDTAWLYGVLVGWEDAAEDPEGGALAEIVARFAMPPEAVARMCRLHAAVAHALDARSPSPAGDARRDDTGAHGRMAGR